MKRLIALLMAISLSVISGCTTPEGVKNGNKEPITITIWHYYNGPQRTALEELITEFNETVGHEKNISVEAVTQGNVVELSENIVKATNGEVGTGDIPDVFAAYADTAYQIDQMGLVADISKYLTDEEISEFIPSYIEEGKLGVEDAIKIFPTAKSTEVMTINKTDWDIFANATGADIEKLNTMEGVAEIAEQYYEYSGGKAFFGRDAMANYMIIGLKQLGVEVFEVSNGKVKVNLDEEAMKVLWENYYIPFIKGHFGAYGKFRSDDVKTGDLIAAVGSTTGAAYFPNEVSIDKIPHQIEALSMRAPGFEDGNYCAVQQGAGMVVTKSEEAQERAAIEFLKWFVKEENNIHFSVESGYMPVKKAANNLDLLKEEMETLPKTQKTDNLINAVKIAIDVAANEEMYTNKAFEKGTEARSILENSLSNMAKNDYKEIEEKVSSGISREEVLEKYTDDTNFNRWYNSIKSEFEALGLL